MIPCGLRWDDPYLLEYRIVLYNCIPDSIQKYINVWVSVDLLQTTNLLLEGGEGSGNLNMYSQYGEGIYESGRLTESHYCCEVPGQGTSKYYGDGDSVFSLLRWNCPKEVINITTEMCSFVLRLWK